MKTLFSLVLIFFFFGCTSINNTSNMYKYPELSKIKLRNYIGKEVESLINDIDNHYHDWYFNLHPPGFYSGVTFLYEKYYIQITISNRLPLNDRYFISEEKENFLDEIRKEKIWRIIISTWSNLPDEYFSLRLSASGR